MTVSIKDLTGGEVLGAGLYDELMRTTKDHLTEEFKEGRIVGADYGVVYLGSMQANLSTASQFLLQYELTNKQLELTDAQIIQLGKQNELLELQKAQLLIANATAQYNLDFIQPEQYAQLQEQTKLVTQQKLNAIAQVELIDAQKAQATAQTLLIAKQEDLVDEQIEDAVDKNLAVPINGLNLAAYNKTQAEIDLLNQRQATEEAQTVGTVTDTNGVLTNTVGGVLGNQMELIYTQRSGFLRDAEQKAAKLHGDAFNVVHSITPDLNLPDSYGLGPIEASLVMDKLRAGINATV